MWDSISVRRQIRDKDEMVGSMLDNATTLQQRLDDVERFESKLGSTTSKLPLRVGIEKLNVNLMSTADGILVLGGKEVEESDTIRVSGNTNSLVVSMEHDGYISNFGPDMQKEGAHVYMGERAIRPKRS